MAHIHTKPGQHDHTVSMYLFRTDFKEPKVMLHLHRKVNLYAQFGGHIELDETPWQTVLHELREETGYDIGQLQLLQPRGGMTGITGAMLHPYPVAHATVGYPVEDGHFHTDSSYAFVTGQAPRNPPAEGESTDIKLFTRAELAALKQDKTDGFTQDIALHIFDECLPNWEVVPTSKFN